MGPVLATPEGTERFRRRFPELAAAGHFRRHGDLWLSSIGLGTYLGRADETADSAYEEAIRRALELGCNVFDTAVNYRHQRSERALGRALERAFRDGVAARDEVFVSTKGGYLPFDGAPPVDAAAYLRSTYVDSGLVAPEELVGGVHAMPPAYLADQLARSRQNLGLAAIDLYYVHNPEAQLREVTRPVFEARLGRALGFLESAAARGEIGSYGIATWKGLRTPAGAADHLDLPRIAALARDAAAAPAFRAVQLPLNLAMPEALVVPTQELDGVRIPLLAAARKLGIAAFTSGSILQGKLAKQLPPEIAAAFEGLATNAQRALQFTRSAPGVTTALVGMGDPDHVEENLALAEVPPADAELLQGLFGRA